MTDITAGDTNDVQIGTDVNGTGTNVQGIVSYVLSVRTQIPTIDGIEARGGPGGQNIRTPGFGTNSGGAGVIGHGGDAGGFEEFHELLPPGPGVVGQGGSSPTDVVHGAPGVIGVAGTGNADGVQGQGTGTFSGVAGFGAPDSSGTGVFGEGNGPNAPGVRGIGSGGPITRPAGAAGVYGQGGPQNPGVVGQAGSAPADGVQGFGTGGFSGVAGFGDPGGNGTGVFGEGNGPNAPGVRGIGSGGPITRPAGAAGVYGQGGPQNPGVVGQAGSAPADGVQGFGTGGFSGVAGFGDPGGNGTGVFGEGNGPNAPGVRGIGSGGPITRPAGAAGVYGQGGPQNPGVVGQAGSAPADGVQGFGTGGFSGVAGFGDPGGNGTGVFGEGRGVGAQGVRGIGSGGPNVVPSSPVGVYGRGGADEAAGVLGEGGIGVFGQGSNVGVVAEGATVGVNGQGHTGVVAASNGQPGSIGLFASGNAANELAGEFLGEVFILGDLVVSGLKSAVVPLADGTHRRLYCVESPDSWFEDVGFGTLANGYAEIRLDADFAATVQTEQYHVFITEYDGSNGLYVTARSATGFEVRAAGAVGASFSYRVMAKRKDIQGARLEEVEVPTPPRIGVDALAERRAGNERLPVPGRS